jgi:hypothetical protein
MGKGGGGGGQPQQVTQTTSNLPEYARPYFENIMQRAQAESYRGYQPYEAERLAGFTPGQMAAQQETLGMQTPGQFGAATGLTGMAGLGSLGAGQQYMGMATDPSQMEAFMSPYQQAVTDVAKRGAIREAQIAQQQTNLGAARQGTYGGARQAIAQAERERGLLDRLTALQAEGGQKSFEAARQAQQFGADLGLRGFGQGIQAGQTLGQLGQSQQQTDLARLSAQELVGAQQRGLEQQRMDQAYADFLRQRDYPQEQLGYYSNLLRGIPIQLGSTQTTYAQPPSIASQVGGLGLAGLSIGKMAGAFAQGGAVDSYAAGGAVASPEELDSFTDKMSDQQLQMKLQNTQPGSFENLMVAGELQARSDLRKKAMSGQGNQQPVIADLLTGGAMPPMPQQMPQQVAMLPENAGGVAALPAPNMENMEPYTAAAGGLVAFSNGGQSAISLDEERIRAERIRGARPGPGVSFSQAFPDAAGSSSRGPFSRAGMFGRMALGPLGMLEAMTGPSEDDITRLREFDRAKDTLKAAGFSDKDIGALKSPDVYRMASGYGYKPATATEGPAGVEAMLAQAERGEGPNVHRPGAIRTDIALPGREPAPTQDAGKKDLSPAAVSAAATPLSMDAAMAQATGLMGGLPTGSAFDDIKAEMKQASEERKAELKDAAYMRLAEFGLGMAAGTSPYFAANVGKAGVEALKGYADDLRQKKKLDADDRKILTDIKRMERADERDNVIKTAEIGTRIFGEMSAQQRAELQARTQLEVANIGRTTAQLGREEQRFENQKTRALQEANDAVKDEMAKSITLAQDPVAQRAMRDRLYRQYLSQLMQSKEEAGKFVQGAGTPDLAAAAAAELARRGIK